MTRSGRGRPSGARGIGFRGVPTARFVTAALGFCALYQLFKFSTNPTFHKTSTPEVRVAHH